MKSSTTIQRLWVVVATALVCLSSAAQQPASNAQLVSELERVFAAQLRAQSRDDDRLDKAVTTAYGLGLEADKRRVAKSMLSQTLGNPALPGYLARFLAPVMGPSLSPAEGRALVQEGILSLKTRGMRRLPVDRQMQYVRYVLGVAAFAAPVDCKALFTGTAAPQRGAQLENAYLAAQSFEDFEAASQLLKEAADAELAGYPSARVLNATQAKGATRAYEAAMRARINRLPSGLNNRFMAAGAAADPKDACLWYRETTAAVLDLQEPYLSWHLTQFLEGL